MGVVNKELIRRGMELEVARRGGALDSKGFSINWESANKEYNEFLIRHGYILMEELNKHLKE